MDKMLSNISKNYTVKMWLNDRRLSRNLDKIPTVNDLKELLTEEEMNDLLFTFSMSEIRVVYI
jgi:hypothetical protein